MKKRSFIAVIAMIMLFVLPVNAAESRLVSAYMELGFNSKTAICVAVIQANSGDEVSATMKLWNGIRCVSTWTDTSMSKLILNETASAISGSTYTLTLDYYVNGAQQTSMSKTATC